jgi:hypothetical protein
MMGVRMPGLIIILRWIEWRGGRMIRVVEWRDKCTLQL